jgi:hypothetical protein
MAKYFQEGEAGEAAIADIKIPPVPENTQICEHWEKAAKRLINHLCKQNNAYLFLEPVDPIKFNIPDYHDIIKQPMDFGTIKNKLALLQYERAEDFIEDIHLVFNNCLLYNGEGSAVANMCKQVRDEARKMQETLQFQFYFNQSRERSSDL